MKRRDRGSLKEKFQDAGLDKPIKIDIDGRQVELDVRAKDVSTFMLVSGDDDMTEEHVDKIEDTLRRMLYRSYLPYYNVPADREMTGLSEGKEQEQEEEKEMIESLLAKHYLDIFMGVMQDLGWSDKVDEKEMNEIKKKAT